MAALADYTLHRHYPEAAEASHPHLALYDAIVERQAALLARWQLVGFIHGVMNTDNMSLAGETIDYGPCAFMDTYDPATVFSSIDSQGRYAYGNQPAIAQWNLARLAEALLPLFDTDQTRAVEQANASIGRFVERFQHHWLTGMRSKLGLFTAQPDDQQLVDGLLTWMHDTKADFTNTFRMLTTARELADDDATGTMTMDHAFVEWRGRWLLRLADQPQSSSEVTTLMQRSNPAVIPRNHKVEEALAAAGEGDLTVLERLLAALEAPYDHERSRPEFISPPPEGGRPYRTFCGT